MNDAHDGMLHDEAGFAPHRAPQGPPPEDSVELLELRGAAIAHRLGYFGSERIVIFGYCPGGGEVVWKDGRSSGFATGGWRVFLPEIAPLAALLGADLGDLSRVGTHVLLMDRGDGKVYAVRREAAEAFLARTCRIPPPSRPCLCALACGTCPIRGCPGITVAAASRKREVLRAGGTEARPSRARDGPGRGAGALG